MKIRSGFVSNSSSASFIIDWAYKSAQSVNFDEAFAKLFDIYCFDNTNKTFDWSKEFINSLDRRIIYESLKGDTVEFNNNKFRTTFFTSMFNGYEDFGEPAKSFCECLLINSDVFEIINSKVDRDT
jgi:hypothetical protein